jgi:hypothetical protein
VEDVGILRSFCVVYGQILHFMDIWYILWSFGTFYGHLVHFVVIWYILWSFGIFSTFWYVVPRIIWQPCLKLESTCEMSAMIDSTLLCYLYAVCSKNIDGYINLKGRVVCLGS